MNQTEHKSITALMKAIKKDMEAEINQILESEEEDGRIFRDCAYNYSELYAKANPEILQDYEMLKEYYDIYN